MSVPSSRVAGSTRIRAMEPTDAPAIARFAEQVRDGERRFLKENLDDLGKGLPRLGTGPTSQRIVAADDRGEIHGVAGAFPGHGWSSHVAELRVVVSAAHRRQGIGRALARAALLKALALGCSQAYVEVVAEQEALVAMFQDMGFEPAALLPDFVRDSAGGFHDLMLLTHRVDEQWGLRSIDLDEVLG